MKRNATSLSLSVNWMASKVFFTLLFSALFCTSVFSQNSPQQDVGDLSAIVWKHAPELNQSLAQERDRMDVALTQPDLTDADRSLYLSYKRLVDYVEADILASKPVNEAIATNYEKVLTEAPNDADLKFLPDGVLMTYLPGLIEALTEVPVPGQ